MLSIGPISFTGAESDAGKVAQNAVAFGAGVGLVTTLASGGLQLVAGKEKVAEATKLAAASAKPSLLKGNPLLLGARAGLITAVAVAEYGLITKVDLPDGPAMGALAGAAIGGGSIFAANTIIDTLTSPRNAFKHPGALFKNSLGLAGIAVIAGGIIGATGIGQED